jgi:predicted alpha/beta hydrolase family esterase
MAYLLLLHGFASSSRSYFLPWLKSRYETEGHTVSAPDFPEPHAPHVDQWTQAYEQLHQTEFNAVVAHSLGGTFALSLLSRKLLACDLLIMIGSSPGPKDNPHMNTFLKYPLDFDAARSNAKEIVTVQSFDDPWTLPEYGIVNVKQSKGYGLFYADKGHFETETLPEEVTAAIDAVMAK